MRKISNLVYLVVTSVFLITSIASFSYLALPLEIQNMFPEWNWLSSIMFGGSTGVVGIGAVYLKYQEAVNRQKQETIYNTVLGEVRDLKRDIKRDIELNETSLKIKRDDKFINAEAKRLIDEVLK